MTEWDDAYLQGRFTEVESDQEADDRMETLANRALIGIVAAIVISVSVIAWLIYKGITA